MSRKILERINELREKRVNLKRKVTPYIKITNDLPMEENNPMRVRYLRSMVELKRWSRGGVFFEPTVSSYSDAECLAFDKEMVALNDQLYDAYDSYRYELLDAYAESEEIIQDGWLKQFNPDMSQAIEMLRGIQPRLDQEEDVGAQKKIDEVIPRIEAGDENAMFEIYGLYQYDDKFGPRYTTPRELDYSEWNSMGTYFSCIHICVLFYRFADTLGRWVTILENEGFSGRRDWVRYLKRIQYGFAHEEMIAMQYFSVCLVGKDVLQDDMEELLKKEEYADSWDELIQEIGYLEERVEYIYSAEKDRPLPWSVCGVGNLYKKDRETGMYSLPRW